MVELKYNFGEASNFIRFINNKLIIEDLRASEDSPVRTGFFPLFFTLCDPFNCTMYTMGMYINQGNVTFFSGGL